MSYLSWKDEYSVGVPLFDEQHKKIFGFINDLGDAISGYEEHAVLRQVLYDLIMYTKVHFSDEEYNLYLYKYDDYEKHKEEHDKLAREVIDFALEFCSKPDLSVEVMGFLKDWILNHILKSDKEYHDLFVNKEIIAQE
ncbi:MAG: bacteriohemerythrin [Candidatus Electryonea clarkiae]|nr:bacteriohemerythrin [Candidatus Electryonea clarkiae]MDP8285268.1 bacteriohemerythrin [Candidatus Electryonea clarkiae]